VKHDDEYRNGHDEFQASRTGDNTDDRLLVGLLRTMQREVTAGFESIREELARLGDAIDRHSQDLRNHIQDQEQRNRARSIKTARK
jgi:hypothetical protein